ncbi:uncharacterized protein LOC115225989 isoform X2 [Octopus sinensis]|uniref:Uncharacterized protein LOC115225989 isoform X2 n=1 Tax=Octopus sinensis TaxID=2607531 RepID=A0A7E6FV20_9MOLL|nr:uncharacterized protein LOC115225989 isoform X2 [Octopus sinensis]
MENDFRNCQNISKVVKNIPPNFTRTVKASKCGKGGSGHPRDSASVQKIDKVSPVSSSDPHVTTAANNTPLNKQSTVCVDEAVTLREMPCGKDTASEQPALHVGRQKVDITAMTNKSQKVFAKLPGLSNPLLQGLSSGDCDKTGKTDITSLSLPNKGQPQQQKSLNYDVGHVFGDMSVAQSGGAEPNQALSNTSSSSNNLFFRASHNTLQVSGEMIGVCQSSLNTCSSSFAEISHQNASESIKNNNFYDNSNTQNVNCKMILSGTGRETSIPVTRTPAQPAASDQPISTGESPKPDLPSTSSPCRTESNTKSNMAITDPERLALIKQRKRERKFRKLQSLSALMRAPDDRHSMVQLNPLRHDRITQENFKQDSGNYSGNSTGSSRLGDITQNPFNWMSSSVGASATAGTGMNFDKKPWRADTGKKTCSFFHEPSMRNNTVLSENFSEMTKNRSDYKTEKKLIDSGSNSWQLHSSNSSVVDDALRVAALKHIKNESPLDDQLLLSASGKVLDINSSNKRILENFLTPRVKKEDSGSESSSSVSSEEENCLSPKIKGLGCKEKMWGSPSKKHRPQSKFGGNMVKFKNGETDSSSLDHFRSPLVNNYQKRTRDPVDYEASGVHSDKSDNTSEDETDNESDNNNSNDDDTSNKSSTAKLFGSTKRKSYKGGVKRRGRPPLSDKFKSQSNKTVKRRGRPSLMSNFGKGEALTKQTKLEKPTTMELDTKPQLKSKDDTADNKIPKRRGRPPKKITYPASASASPTPMSIDTLTPAVALSSLNAPTLAEGSNLVDISPTSPPSELTSEELLKARLNLPRRRGRPSKVDVMLREMAAAHLATGQPVALPTPEAVAAALAQTAEVPAKKKKVNARRRYHAYGQRKRRRRKNTNLLRTLSTVAAELDAGAEGGPPPSELARGEEGASGVSGGGVNFHQMVPAHQTAYNEVEGADDDDEEEEEDEEGEDMERKVEVYSDRGSTAKEVEEEDKALINRRHFTDRHHHRRHHRHHHHQLQESQGHNNNNNNNNNTNSHHRQLPLSSTSSSSSLQTLPSSANIVVSLSELPRRTEPAGEEQQLVGEPNAKKRQKKRKKDAGGEGDVKKQRSGEVVSGTSVGGSSSSNNNNNNNNNSLKEVVKQEEEEEEDSVLLANGNTFRVKMMKSKPNSSAKGPVSAFANLKGLKKEVPVEHGGEENRPAAAHTTEKPKSRNKKTTPSSSFSSSSTKAGVIKISRNSNNNNKTKVNSNNSSSSSSSSNFKCSLCGAVFSDALTLKNHVDLCDGLPDGKRLSESHKCSICERSFKFKQSLLNHMRRHTGERPFVCELCDKSFMQAGNLERHRRTHERDTTAQSPAEEKGSNKPFTCEYCEKVFTVEATYQIHLKEHDGEGNEQLHCPYCDELFASRHMLKLHKRTHNEHRPFKCSTCSRCYKHKHSLVEHQHNCR